MADLVKYLSSEAETHPVLVSGIAQFQLVHMGLLISEGATNKLVYRMKETG
jgi:hypothetical protein